MDGRRLLRGRLGLVALRRESPWPRDDPDLGHGQLLRGLLRGRRGPAPSPTDEYYTNFFEKTVRQKAVFGELTFDLTDKWSVTGGARWFEFDRQEVESNEVPRGLPVFDYDPDVGYFLASPLVSEGKDDDVVMKLATQYRFDDTKCSTRSTARVSGSEARTARARPRGEWYRSNTSRTCWRTTKRASRASGSITACCSMFPCSSWNGRTSSCAATRARRSMVGGGNLQRRQSRAEGHRASGRVAGQ